jgi:SAM-dependent methyltransferase
MLMARPPTTLPSGARVDPGAVLHYADPAAYDQRYATRADDVAYYLRAARRAKGPVLEYGCGTGRITLPLARAGLTVTGVDLSRAMLDRLRVHLRREPADVRQRVSLRHRDMRVVRFRRRFACVIAGFNTFQHLYTREDVESFLVRVRHHLAPGGTLRFDVYLPQMEELEIDEPGSSYDPLTQTLHQQFSSDGGDQLTHRQFFPRELEMLLAYNGFGRIRFTADFTTAPLHPDATSLVVSCRPLE